MPILKRQEKLKSNCNCSDKVEVSSENSQWNERNFLKSEHLRRSRNLSRLPAKSLDQVTDFTHQHCNSLNVVTNTQM